MNTNTMSKFAVAAAVCAAMAILPSYADTNITEHIMLTEDADWTSLGAVNIAAGAGIHLNGHNLTVSSFTGSGSIYSSTLPLGYAALEYVESTGAQYIDTGVSSRTDNSGSVKVEADISYEGGDGTTYTPLLGASNPNKNVVGLWISPSSGKNYWTICNNDKWLTGGLVVSGRRQSIVAAWKTKYQNISTNGVANVLNQANTTANTVAYSMYLPARNNGGTLQEKGKFKMYSVKIYRPDTTLVRDYVPVKRLSDNVVGFYDRVSGTFSPSATETAFVDGPEVERGGGELRINVASGTFQNSTVAISNSVKVVKQGAGTYTSNKQQYYTGGTDVNAGKISFKYTASTSGCCGFGTWGTAINVASNAQVVVNNEYQTLNGYNVTIAGDGPDGNGAIYGNANGKRSSWNSSYIGSLVLSGDASIKTIADDAFNLNLNSQGIDITLNGHTLTANGSARFIVWSGNVVDTGKIVSNIAPESNGANKFYTHGNGVSAPLADFEVAQGKALGGESPMTVSNLVMRGAYYPRNGVSYNVTVLGRYSPKGACTGNPKVTLGDATHLSPVFDLSDLSSTYDGSRGITFAEDSTVTVYVGTRTIAVGDKLVSWSSQPDLSVSFALTGDGWTAAEREIALSAREDGLYVKTTAAPAYATLDVANDEWQFFAADGTPYSEAWTDGVTADMQVRFASYAEYQAIKAKNVTPSAFVMTAFAIPEGTGAVDASSGMDFQFDEGLVIDVKGNSLKLPSGMMFGSKAFTVTSSVAGGEVLIDVPSGTSRNTSMALSDSLKVTKTGAGTFVSAKAQTYTGGTFVNGGRAQPPDPPSQDSFTYSWDQFKAFGTGDIVVSSNATFDIRANYAYRGIIMLNGGTLTSSGPYDMNSTGSAGSGIGALSADSTLDVVRRMVVGDEKDSFSCDLGGRVLDINLSHGDSHELRLRSALTNGIVRVHGTRVLEIYNALDMSTTTLELGSALKLYATLDLKDYIAAFNSPYIAGTGTMNVHGSFRPECDYFYACKMLDGSTLDLSKRTTMFSTTTKSLASGWGPSGTISYANNATIKVKLGERKVWNGTKFVGWSAKPTNNVKFVAADGEPRRSFAIKDDGLYAYSGFIVIVR